MRWFRRGGALVPEKDQDEQRADQAAEVYEFDEEEREQFLKLQRAMAGDPVLAKKVVKRIKKMERARGMSTSISTKRRK